MFDTTRFPAPPAVVADVGCGHGDMTAALAEHGWTTIAVDAEPSLVAAAVARAGSGAHGVVADVRRLPFRSSGLDGVLALEVLEHLGQPAELTNEIARVLRSGGAALVATPTGYTESVYKTLNPKYWATTTHQQVFSKQRLQRELEKAGLVVTTIQPIGFDWAVKWLAHSALRSKFDFTGTIHDHPDVNGKVDRALAKLDGSSAGHKVLDAVRKRVGKSFWAYCRRP